MTNEICGNCGHGKEQHATNLWAAFRRFKCHAIVRIVKSFEWGVNVPTKYTYEDEQCKCVKYDRLIKT